MSEPEEKKSNFIRDIIDDDLRSGKHKEIVTRFPPEPNGYLHIGHATTVCLNFGLGQDYPGHCHLRFDDTNPVKEDDEYTRAIQEDIRWLGFDWGDHIYFTSDYFGRLYEGARTLIEKGLAYVDDLTADEMRDYRGTLTKPGKNSPHRDRSVEENLKLFMAMKNGEFEDGKCILRAKIDMSSSNMNMRDPSLYRIRRATHHRTGDDWCIYPMYDFAHPASDAIEGITHSLCSLEFENHRPLYDWVVENVDWGSNPRQIEFARFKLTYTILSKRKLIQLVEEKKVAGWDDPRMPTVSGLRRRGVPAAAIRKFCDDIGMTKNNTWREPARFEFWIRKELEESAPRVGAVLDPLKVVITNYPDDKVDEFDAPNHPMHESFGSRTVHFSKELWIERADFMEDPPKKFFRLAPGKEVRLRKGYWVKCEDVIKDDSGKVIELRCTYDPETPRGKNPPDGRKVKGTLHWVSAAHAIDAEVRLYDNFFSHEYPGTEGDFLDEINPDSLKVITAKVEPHAKTFAVGQQVQFERNGYFVLDRDSTEDSLIFNRTIGLKDSWAKMQKQQR